MAVPYIAANETLACVAKLMETVIGTSLGTSVHCSMILRGAWNSANPDQKVRIDSSALLISSSSGAR